MGRCRRLGRRCHGLHARGFASLVQRWQLGNDRTQPRATRSLAEGAQHGARQQPRGSGAACGLVLQARCDELFEPRRGRFRWYRWVRVQHPQHHLERRHARVRRGAARELDGGDPKRPDVRGGIVAARLLKHLGRHPAVRADKGRCLGAELAPPVERGREAKVGEAHVTFGVDEDATRLEVAVQRTVLVHVREAAADLTQHNQRRRLLKSAGKRAAHDVGARTASVLLHHEPERVVDDEGGVQLRKVLVAELPHCLHLPPHILE